MSTPEPTRNGSTGSHFLTMIITLALAVVLVPFLGPLVQPRVIDVGQNLRLIPTDAPAPRPTIAPTALPVSSPPLTTLELSEAARPSLVLVERKQWTPLRSVGLPNTPAMTTTLPATQTTSPTASSAAPTPAAPVRTMRLGVYQLLDRGAGIVYAVRDDKAYILTSARVASGGESTTIWVTLAGADTVRPARVLAVSHCDDLAMLVVDDPSGLTPIRRPGMVISDLPVQPMRPTQWVLNPNVTPAPVVNLLPQITLGSSADVRPGQELIALGYMRGDLGNDTGASQPAIITSVVSASGVAWQQHPELVRFAALSGPGYAGGPVIDRYGKLIGITTFAPLQGAGIAYAISIDYAHAVAEQLLQGINPHWTGLSLETRRELDGHLITVITQVQAGSPAASAGIQAGDVVISLKGSLSATVGAICTDLRQRQDGEQVTLTVQRTISGESTPQELSFTLTIGRP